MDAAMMEGERLGFHPLRMAVLDPGGHLLAAKRDHRASIGRPGVLIRDAAGLLLGAVGISGDTADHDEACALAGIAAVGAVSDRG